MWCWRAQLSYKCPLCAHSGKPPPHTPHPHPPRLLKQRGRTLTQCDWWPPSARPSPLLSLLHCPLLWWDENHRRRPPVSHQLLPGLGSITPVQAISLSISPKTSNLGRHYSGQHLFKKKEEKRLTNTGFLNQRQTARLWFQGVPRSPRPHLPAGKRLKGTAFRTAGDPGLSAWQRACTRRWTGSRGGTWKNRPAFISSLFPATRVEK